MSYSAPYHSFMEQEKRYDVFIVLGLFFFLSLIVSYFFLFYEKPRLFYMGNLNQISSELSSTSFKLQLFLASHEAHPTSVISS